jgi:hypothetical protein
MSTILHLSDLHLGEADVWERQTDDKVGLVPQDENTRLSVIRTSLKAVKRHLDQAGDQLDAVVVSGDVTSRHDQSGFERFGALLAEVDLVPTEKIVVVPGNHDVDWQSEPGTEAKYARFLEHTRAQGMRTPLCDGVDFVADPAECKAGPVLPLADCVLVALNSANWCGVKLGADGDVYDVARISEPQLDRLTDILRGYETGDLVRIAVLHHHLLPVTEDEEVKQFESFTNLARLRGWLRHHRFHAVMHGHKHQPALTWDHVYDLGDHRKPARRILVISAPTPTSWGAPLCRLIRTGEATGRRLVPQAPCVLAETVRAERHERTIEPEGVSLPLDPGSSEPLGLVAIDAPTADAAYERLVQALDAHPGKLLNVTCVVRDPESAAQPPTNFARGIPENIARGIPEIADVRLWMNDAVSWWQEPAPELVATGEAPFNHGERLYAVGLDDGPLDHAAKRLGSTKATVLLVRPGELRAGGETPAFVAVQLVKATDAEGDRLDCVGYFRKQDLTLWWPVNIAELRAIQKHVLDLPVAKRMRAGRLVTIATEAIYDDVFPELAGTVVDRFVDLRPELLMEMAYGVAHSSADEQDTVLKLWTDVLKDIGGTGNFPSLGIERLLEHLRVFRDVGNEAQLKPLIKRLEVVSDRAHRAKTESRTKTDRERFSKELFEMVGEVLEAVEETMRARHGTAASDTSG